MFNPKKLDEPGKKKKPAKIFVVSAEDLFGEWVPDEWIDEVFRACFDTDKHTYMFLTKNPVRYDKALDYISGEERGFEIEHWDNMWFGATMTCREDVHKVNDLITFSEGHKFLSIEPLLGEIDISR